MTDNVTHIATHSAFKSTFISNADPADVGVGGRSVTEEEIAQAKEFLKTEVVGIVAPDFFAKHGLQLEKKDKEGKEVTIIQGGRDMAGLLHSFGRVQAALEEPKNSAARKAAVAEAASTHKFLFANNTAAFATKKGASRYIDNETIQRLDKPLVAAKTILVKLLEEEGLEFLLDEKHRAKDSDFFNNSRLQNADAIREVVDDFALGMVEVGSIYEKISQANPDTSGFQEIHESVAHAARVALARRSTYMIELSLESRIQHEPGQQLA